MKTDRWKPILYRRNAREEEFLQIPQGFWAPLLRLLDTPHLAGAAVALLQAGLPRRFGVRSDCPGHAQDAAARLLPLVLYRDALDLAPLVALSTGPQAIRSYAKEQLSLFSSEDDRVCERQVLVCRTLSAAGLLQPAVPENCPLPVLVQISPGDSLTGDALQPLESCGGPVMALLTGDAPGPEGWPVLDIPAAPDDWYGELLFQLFYRSPTDSMNRREARIAAEGLLQRYGRVLTEQDFALAVDYVRRRQGPDVLTNAAYFLQLVRQIPRGILPCCPAGSDPVFFRQSQLCDILKLSDPLLAVAAWKHCARKAPRPYPHPDAPEQPEGLPAGLHIRNRMLYAPPADPGLHTPCTLLVAEDQGDREEFYGRRLHDVHSYAELAGAAAALAQNRTGVRCWVLAVDCAPEDLRAEDIRRAPYAFCAQADALTLYDGPEGLRAFAQAAGALMARQIHR